MTVWVCSVCGMAGARPSVGRPSLDDRYAVGYCPKCAPFVEFSSGEAQAAANRPNVRRPTVPLVRSDLWDPSVLQERDEKRKAERLLRDFGNADETGTVRDSATKTRPPKVLSKADTDRARELLAEQEAAARARSSPPGGPGSSEPATTPALPVPRSRA